MGILTFNENGEFKQESALTAAALCVVPGLGQIYNGEARKGLLYFFAGAANALFLTLICAKSLLLAGANYIGSNLHMRLNPAVMDCLRNLDVRSPQMLLLCVLLASFTIFCLRDAVQTRGRLRKREIYANQALAISEAASGSYIMHALMFVSMFLLVLFLFVPPAEKKQVTEIVFTEEQPETKKPVVTTVRSTHNSENGGKARPKPILNSPRQSQEAPAKATPKAQTTPVKQPSEAKKETPAKAPAKQPTTEPKAEPKTEPKPEPKAESKVTPTPQPPKPLMPKFEAPRVPSLPAPAPTPAAAKNSNPVVTPTPAIQPTRTSSTASATSNAPQPLLAMGSKPSMFGATPTPVASSSSGKSSPTPAPAPASSHGQGSNGSGPPQPQIQKDAGQTGAGSAPAPVPSSEGPSHRGTTAPGGGAPTPQRSSSGPSGHSGPVMITPVGAPRGLDNGGQTATDKDNDRKSPGIAALAADYGPYMADLQRRIKRSWFPPRAPSSKTTIVVFKIDLNGELSNLRIFRSSGDSTSDQAALKAVENAAPFKHLPPNSDDTIDVQFTFDYNLFTGSRGSSGMKF